MKLIGTIIANVVAIAIVVLIFDYVPWRSIFSGVSEQTSAANVSSSHSTLDNVAGRWKVENGDLKGLIMLFTASGATTWAFPNDLEMSECTVTGTYKIGKSKGTDKIVAGTYFLGTLSSKSGSCKDRFSHLPESFDVKLDFVDSNHLLFDTESLVRMN